MAKKKVDPTADTFETGKPAHGADVVIEDKEAK